MVSVLAVVVLACCCFSATRARQYDYGMDDEYDPSGPIQPSFTSPPTAASVEDLRTLVEQLSARVGKLEGECNGKSKVAFAASLVKQEERAHLGPYEQDTTLVFQKVTTNVGDAYNNATGIFIAPLRGVYYMRFTVNVGNTGSVNAALLRNGENVVAVYETAGVHNSGANGVTLQLEKGDEVFVAMWRSHSVFDNSKLSTFSGFLIFPM